MVGNFRETTIILLLIHIVRLGLTGSLCILIVIYDVFFLIVVITIILFILITISLSGIYLNQKWGRHFAIINGVYDIVLNCIIYYTVFNLLLLFILSFAFFFAVLTIILAWTELKFVESWGF